MGFLGRRNKRTSDRPATPASVGSNANAGLFSRIFGRKPPKSNSQIRETARKRRSVRLEASASGVANGSPVIAAEGQVPAPPSRRESMTPSVKHKSSISSSATGEKEKGGLLGFVKKRSSRSLRSSMVPVSSSAAAVASGAPPSPSVNSPLYNKMATRPVSTFEPTGNFPPPSPSAVQADALQRAQTLKGSLTRRQSGLCESSVTPSDLPTVDVPPPLPPKANPIADENPSADADEHVAVRAVSPPPRPAAALETLEMAAPLSMGSRAVGAQLVRGRSISGPGKAVNASVTTVTTNADAETVISPPQPTRGESLNSNGPRAETPISEAHESVTSGTIHTLTLPLGSPPVDIDGVQDYVLPSPVGLKVEYMPTTPGTPGSVNTEKREEVPDKGIAKAAAVGATAAAAIATTEEPDEIQPESPKTAMAPALSPPFEPQTVADKPAPIATSIEQLSPTSDSSFQTPLGSAWPAEVPKPAAVTPMLAVSAAENVSEEIVDDKPVKPDTSLRPPVITVALPKTPEATARVADKSTAISTPTVLLEQFSKENDEEKTPVAPVKTSLASEKTPLLDVTNIASPTSSMEEIAAFETIATTAPVLTRNNGSTYDLTSDDGNTPPLSPADTPIVSPEFKAATALPTTPVLPSKDALPVGVTGQRVASVGTATATLATIVPTLSSSPERASPPLPEKTDSEMTIIPPGAGAGFTGLKKTLSVHTTPTKLPTPITTPQRANTLTPRRTSTGASSGGYSPHTPSSFKSGSRTPATPDTPGSTNSDATLDEFMGLFKTVITRDKGTSIRDAARRAEHRGEVA